LAVLLGEAEVVAATDGQGVGDALLTAVADGLAEELDDACGVGVGLALELALAEVDGVAVAAGPQMPLGMAEGASSV
jgi:hypothetical protein